MPRRPLLSLAALALAGALLPGCAEDVAPAASAGAVEISHDDLMAEVDEWADSAALLAALGITTTSGAGEGSYDTGFVDTVLTNRILFDVHNAEFERLGLELTPADLEGGLFTDPAQSDAVIEQLDPDYYTQLREDVARQLLVSESLGAEEYERWRRTAFDDVDVNPRYGSWSSEAGAVVAPTGPQPAPTPGLIAAP